MLAPLIGVIMNYSELRKELLEISGRADLIDHMTHADKGIKKYINAGLRWLDLNFQGQGVRKRFLTGIVPGTYSVRIPHCRVIEEVWVNDSVATYRLTPTDIAQLRALFPNAWASAERGPVLYFAINSVASAPINLNRTADEATYSAALADVATEKDLESKNILIMPPNECEISLEVWGLFFTEPVVNDEDTNWWMTNFSSLVMDATMREIEVKHRNTQGVRDWEATLFAALNRIEQDQADEIAYDINVMEG